jgi:ubiquinone biosynthesis protein
MKGPFSGIEHTIQDINRLGEILTILTKHGFGFVVERMNLASYLPAKPKKKTGRSAKLSTPTRLRLVLEELGPTFIKLGQALAMRPDMLPRAYIKSLSKLQDRVEPFAPTGAEKIVREELGQPLKKIFKSFNKTPFAAASIAQVHEARTIDNQHVVIKIQRPGLKRIVESDLEILKFMAQTWERVIGTKMPRKPTEFMGEFENVIREELDFLVEARHLERFKENFKNRPEYAFPAVYWHLSSKRCLTLQYIEGSNLLKAAKRLADDEKEQLAQLLFDAYIQMTLHDRFFHADPHAGNFIVNKDGILTMIDTGQVGRLDRETVEAFTDMLICLVDQDTDGIVDAYLRLGTADEAVDRRMLKRDTAIFLEQYYNVPVERLSFGKALQELAALSSKYSIQLPQDFVVLAKTFLGVEGLARQLNPELNIVDAARPEAERIIRRRYDPREIGKTLIKQAKEFERFLIGLPAQLQDLLIKLQHGNLKIEFEHKGLEQLLDSICRASNRLSFALIVAALIVGSSLLLFSKIGPSWYELSLLGLAGYLLAGFLGVLLIIAILRSGRL